MREPTEILASALQRAASNLNVAAVEDKDVVQRLESVCECTSNRAGARLLLSCMLAKAHNPALDPRQPFTEIGSTECFSGRGYDEQYIGRFVIEQKLPCNSTTAFLTPAFRNMDSPLAKDAPIIGRPRQMYVDLLAILEAVALAGVEAFGVLTDAVRLLLRLKKKNEKRLSALIESASVLRHEALSGEEIVALISQHLACRNASRLPVLVVAAAYRVAADRMGEAAKPLRSHTAADERTGALGDVEVCLLSDEDVVTSYEMKMKRVSMDDIDRAIQKIVVKKPQVQNYIFITTEPVSDDVREYAATVFDKAGTEIAILDCIGFLRHFLHFFYRLRFAFLNAYQELLLSEPASAVRQSLKEAFLTLRQAAESEE